MNTNGRSTKSGKIDRRISIAPMMSCTDRHYRYFARLMSSTIHLYSEMVTTAAIIYGNRHKLLAFNPEEHSLALQLGGSNPIELALCSTIAEDYGYDEINLNVGCPSSRVQSGQFGACLMKKPELVAECVAAMRHAVGIPITVKTRIGVDERDSYEDLVKFVSTVASSGAKTFIIHARKAWLSGLSPRENREIPPLVYDRVYQLKQDFPALEIIINGGIKSRDEVEKHLQWVDGVMIGREAYSNPWLIVELESYLTGQVCSSNPHQVIAAYLAYVEQELAKGSSLRALTRFLLGMFQGQPGARLWRRHLTEYSGGSTSGVINQALEFIGRERPLSQMSVIPK